MRRPVFLLYVSLTLAGCGQSGPLYLPEPVAEEAVPPPPVDADTALGSDAGNTSADAAMDTAADEPDEDDLDSDEIDSDEIDSDEIVSDEIDSDEIDAREIGEAATGPAGGTR